MAVYKGLEATLHEAFWGDRGSDLEVKDIIRLFPGFKGRALEVGAGSGRIMRPLTEAGWQIDGIEPSAEMVEMYHAGEVSGQMYQATLEDFEQEQKYDLILLTSYVFQLFGDAEEVLKKVRSMLTEKGRIYFSVFIPWSEIVGEIPEGEWLVDDQITLQDRRKARCWVNFELDRIGQKLVRQHRYEILEKKKVVEKTDTVQEILWYTKRELELLAEKAACGIDQRSYEFKSEYDSDAHSMSFVFSI